MTIILSLWKPRQSHIKERYIISLVKIRNIAYIDTLMKHDFLRDEKYINFIEHSGHDFLVYDFVKNFQRSEKASFKLKPDWMESFFDLIESINDRIIVIRNLNNIQSSITSSVPLNGDSPFVKYVDGKPTVTMSIIRERVEKFKNFMKRLGDVAEKKVIYIFYNVNEPYGRVEYLGEIHHNMRIPTFKQVDTVEINW